MSSGKTRIACDIDFEQPGRQTGSLRLSHSDNLHAYGHIPIPIVQLQGPLDDDAASRGSLQAGSRLGAMQIGATHGPSVLICAGNHGDEYEGQLLIRRLMRELNPAHLQGRLLLLPALNYPAVLAGSRVSPLDDGNMNRAFPGDPDGSPTAAIAHFVDSVLLPRCDVVIDLHAGGVASEYVPCVYLYHRGDSALWARKLAACRAFGLPYTILAGGEDRSLSAAAERHGCLMLATELAGGGSVQRQALELAYQGVLRVLQQCGLLSELPASVPAPAPTRFCKTHDFRYFVTSPRDGLFEPACDLGDAVSAGQLAGYVYALDDPAAEAQALHFQQDGIVLCRRVPARVRRGDYVFHLGAEIPPAVLEVAPDTVSVQV